MQKNITTKKNFFSGKPYVRKPNISFPKNIILFDKPKKYVYQKQVHSIIGLFTTPRPPSVFLRLCHRCFFLDKCAEVLFILPTFKDIRKS